MFSTSLLFVGGFGPMEMGIILLLAVLLFGANKLPKLARSSGQAIGEFKKGRDEIEAELKASRMEKAAKDAAPVDADEDIDSEDEIGEPILETESDVASVDDDATPAA